MALENLEIIEGEAVKEHLKAEELDLLIRAWIPDLFPVRLTAEETRADVARILEPLKEVISQGDMVIARENGKAIGMIKVSKINSVGSKSDYAGKEIFEIGKASVLPEARGNGVYQKLRERVIDHIKNKYGEMHILSSTKNQTVKNLNHQMGWKEIGYLEYLRIHGYSEKKIAAQNTPDGYIQKEGWTAFIYEPNQS